MNNLYIAISNINTPFAIANYICSNKKYTLCKSVIVVCDFYIILCIKLIVPIQMIAYITIPYQNDGNYFSIYFFLQIPLFAQEYPLLFPFHYTS